MRIRNGIKLAAGAALLAATLYAIAAAPGVLSDRDSLVPVGTTPVGTTRQVLR